MTERHALDYQKALEILDKAGEDHARERPNWRLETLWGLVSGTLETLREALEDLEDPDPVSWDDPWLVAQYPAAWDWEKNALRLDYLTKTRLEGTVEELAPRFAEAFLEYRGLLLLSELTGHLGVYETGDKREPLLTPELSKAWDESTKEQREEFVRIAYRPFSIGTVPLDLDRLPEDGEPIGEALGQELAQAWEDVPRVTFEGEAGGKPYAGELVLMFEGLTVNADERRAYFPLTVGLAFYVDQTAFEMDESFEPDFPDPSTWTEDERRALWDGLFEYIRAEVEKLLPEDAARGETGASGVLVPERSRSPVVLWESPTRWSHEGRDLARSFRRLGLPKKLPPRWEDLEAQEIARILDEEGEAAFFDLRKLTRTPGARGPLLEKRSRSVAGELVPEVSLASEAKEALLDRVGPTGFRKLETGADGRREEFFVKRWRVRGEPVSFGFSLYGEAWPLIKEAKEERRRELEERLQQGDLFEDPEVRERVENELRTLAAAEDAAIVAEALLDRFGQVGADFDMTAAQLKLLLRCEGERDAFRRVLGCLKALRNWNYRFQMGSASGEASFLAGFDYQKRGPGGHGDGVFRLHLGPRAIGSLSVFSLTGPGGPKGELLFSWTEKKPKKELLGARWEQSPTALLSYFASAQGFGHEERDLDRDLFKWLVRNVDPTAPGRENVRARRGTRGAMEPRLYEADFRPYRDGPRCSLLPPGRRFVGALGRKGREKGFPLNALLLSQGVETRGRRNWQRREKEVRELFDRMENVVEGARGGIVAVLYRWTWLSLRDARNLGAPSLQDNASFFFFLPEDWKEAQRKKLEDHGATVIEDRRISEAWTSGAELGDLPGKLEQAERGGLEILPLHERLKAARKERGLKQAEAAALFGVSRQLLAAWENRRKPIRADFVPFLERWSETGQAPTPAELEALRGGRE